MRACKGPSLDTAGAGLASTRGWMDATLIPGFPLSPTFGDVDRAAGGVEGLNAA